MSAADPGTAAPATRPRLFREQALRRHAGAREHGDVVRLPPRWTRYAYPIVLGMMLGALAFAWVGRVTQYARGPAVVREIERESRYELIALFPAAELPRLRVGQPLRFEPEGYARATTSVSIDEIGDRPIGMVEARRALGPAADARVEIPASVVLAVARLPGARFRTADGERAYHEGMVALAETPVRSERIAYALFPALRALAPE
jgi:hypothetical protein